MRKVFEQCELKIATDVSEYEGVCVGFETLSRSGEQIFFSIPAAAVRFETLFLKYFSDTVPTKRDTFYHSLQYLSDV